MIDLLANTPAWDFLSSLSFDIDSIHKVAELVRNWIWFGPMIGVLSDKDLAAARAKWNGEPRAIEMPDGAAYA